MRSEDHDFLLNRKYEQRENFHLAKRKVKKINNKQRAQKDTYPVSDAKVTIGKSFGVVRMTRFRQRLDLSKSLSSKQTKVSGSNETTRNCS